MGDYLSEFFYFYKAENIENTSVQLVLSAVSVRTGRPFMLQPASLIFSVSVYALRKFYGSPTIVECVRLLFKYLTINFTDKILKNKQLIVPTVTIKSLVKRGKHHRFSIKR